MAVQVRIPTPLRRFTEAQATVEVEGHDVADALSALFLRAPGLKAQLLDEQGAVRRFVNLYVNGEDIRFLEGQRTPLRDQDQLAIVPAIAGGRSPGRS